MMARNHIISGLATAAFTTGGAYLFMQGEAASGVEAGFHSAVASAWEYMTCGEPLFSLYGALTAVLYALGLLLPDIDSRKSTLGRFVHLPVKHRTWTHSIWPVIVLAAAGHFLWRPVTWLAFGYFVHLFWDSFSRMGICWFYPIPGFIEYESGARVKRNHWFWIYKAGRPAETVLAVVSCVPAAVVVVMVAMGGAIPLTLAA